MILTNPMEQKQLNFNQPLLSVRRGSSVTTPLEVNKRKTNKSHPSLPPLPYYKSDLKSGPVSNPGAIPFKWEQKPGRPKEENNPQRHTLDQLPCAPKLPPGRIIFSPEISPDENIHSENEGFEKEMEDENISSSEDENTAYLDARDRLSRTESFFYNCSISGVSGLDGPNLEPSGGFSDPQTRDFMMGRFLPAAKAVASETPQFASRKQTKPVKVVEKMSKKSPKYYSIPDMLHFSHHVEEEKEGKDGEYEYDGIKDSSAKICGLLPKFCLLNPIPGMRDHAQVISPVRSVRTRSAYGGAYSRNENKGKDTNHRGEQKRITPQNDSTDKSSMNGHSYKNESPLSFLDRDKGFLGLPEESRDFLDSKTHYTRFKDLLAEEITSPINPATEKTFYLDSEQMVESRNSNSTSSESRGRNPSVDYSFQDFETLSSLNEKPISQPKTSEIADFSDLSTSQKSSQEVRDLQKDQDLHLAIDFPLLPKSPSESWLSRTLPSMSSKNPASMSYLGSPGFRPSPVDPSRVRMLRTNLQDMVFGPRGELAPILEN